MDDLENYILTIEDEDAVYYKLDYFEGDPRVVKSIRPIEDRVIEIKVPWCLLGENSKNFDSPEMGKIVEINKILELNTRRKISEESIIMRTAMTNLASTLQAKFNNIFFNKDDVELVVRNVSSDYKLLTYDSIERKLYRLILTEKPNNIVFRHDISIPTFNIIAELKDGNYYDDI